jgi:hypothetical protein
MWTVRIVIVSFGIRRRRSCESFCHVRVIRPDTDLVYPVQRSHFLASGIQLCLHHLAFAGSAVISPT